MVARLGYTSSFLPDGRTIVFEQFSIRGDNNLFQMTIDEGADPVALIESPHSIRDPAVSPGGRLLAYTSDESGRSEVWVTTLPGAKGKRQVSQEGGVGAIWSRDGRTLFYKSEGVIYAVAVGTGDPSTFGVPKALFDRSKQKLVDYDLLPDDSGFAMVQKLTPKNQGLMYVQNWYAEFAKK